MFDYIPLSVSLHIVQSLGWIFALVTGRDALKSELFSKHMQVNVLYVS